MRFLPQRDNPDPAIRPGSKFRRCDCTDSNHHHTKDGIGGDGWVQDLVACTVGLVLFVCIVVLLILLRS